MGLPRQFELLLRGQRESVRVIRDIEIRQEPKETLLFLFFDLPFCQFDSRGSDFDSDGTEGKGQSNRREVRDLARVEDARYGLLGESRCRHGEAEWPGRNIRKRELAVLARKDLGPWRDAVM